MNARQWIGSVMLAATCVLLASCIDSKTPLCSPDQAKNASELCGIWQIKRDDGQVQYYHVGRAGDKLPANVLRLVQIIRDKNGVVSRPEELLAFATDIGENQYLNVTGVGAERSRQFAESGWKPELVDGFFILKYQAHRDAVDIWPMDPDARRAAIESGKIQGKIEKKYGCITDTPENIAKLLTVPESERLFFKKAMRCERIQ